MTTQKEPGGEEIEIPKYEYNPQECEWKDQSVPLFDAVRHQDFDSVRKLVKEKKFDVNARDPDGETPLHEASKVGNKEIVRFLIENGAEVDGVGIYHLTPLMYAARHRNFRVFQYLMEHGANATRLNKFRQSALHFACESGAFPTLGYLIPKLDEREVNRRDVLGQTPLHIAAERGNREVVKYLLMKGARFDIEDIENYHPNQIAKEEVKPMFNRVKIFEFSLGENEERKIVEMKRELSKLQKTYEQLSKELKVKEDRYYNEIGGK